MIHMTFTLPAFLTTIVGELMELHHVYGYMIQNAPTEEARRMVEMNRMTVHHTMEKMKKLYMEMGGKAIPPLHEEALEEPRQFTNFVDAARYAFKEEAQLFNWLKELYLIADACYRDVFFDTMHDHALNAMRLLYLIG
ncbi:MAG: hypothetical protein ACOY3J_07480 [Bacillota bacterium]|uniref:Uncharacterized protein n=1 Tax=Thermanaerosceptrum fracticalcis TaxID=1712410 RepID=A0A7G6E2D7_THEFR|nr:hypothetical protein [Thermanaerosceptrum fracticalcis]QNB46241.1 hypothetical protein BR63_07895 [Thermanaerosceptrum fracticalcis]